MNNAPHNPNVEAPDEIDLAQLDDDYGQAEVEEREHEPVPDGKYQVNVDKVELTRARTSGNPMLKWTLRILGPTHAGRLLWRNNVMATPANLRWLKTDLNTCGLHLEKLSDLPSNLDKLLDLTLEVVKKTNGENESVYLNKRVVLDDSQPRSTSDDLRAF